MPDGIFVIIVVAIIAGTFLGIVKAILGYLASKHELSGSKKQPKQREAPGSSLTTSELHAMIRNAVEEATAPLAARVEHLEHQQLQAPDPSPLLNIPDDESAHTEIASSSRRRVS